MSTNIFVPAIVSMALVLPLSAQSDFEYNLARRKGNKIVLLGQASANDLGKWRQVIDSDEIFGHGFTLLNRQALVSNTLFGISDRNIDDFERWFRQHYGLSNSARWGALDMKNNLIVSGIQTPETKEFDQMLERQGIKTPARQLRDFLRENPDHIDAMTDLLNEVRRRALHVMPSSSSEDLDTETDLRTWAVLANETDKAFSGSWVGIDINFFRLDQEQPERHSKLMRDVFRKHISKVEMTVREQPLNGTLWNIWAWMARSSPEYNWKLFVSTIEPVRFPYSNISHYLPPPEVCAWLVEESKNKSDWETVIKYAVIARQFSGHSAGRTRVEWVPGGAYSAFASDTNHIKDYPAKSAYAPHLEALLKLGRVDEANDVYDEMIRIEGKEDHYAKMVVIDGKSERYKANNALIAADAARSAGMEDVAIVWEQGELISKHPWQYFTPMYVSGFPLFFINADGQSDYYKKFYNLVSGLSAVFRIYAGSSQKEDFESLGWKKEDGDRWAIIGSDLRVIEQGEGMPDATALESILYRNNLRDEIGSRRAYMSEYGAQPGLELDLALIMIGQTDRNLDAAEKNQTGSPMSAEGGDDPFAEAARTMSRLVNDRHDLMMNLTSFYYSSSNQITKSQSMYAIAGRLLPHLETLLARKPSSGVLWNQWLFWRGIQGANRSIDLLIEEIKSSPVSQPGTVPPASVFNTYYDECRREGKWDKVIKLLRTVWDREFTRVVDLQKENPNFKVSETPADRYTFSSIEDLTAHFIQSNSAALGDRVGIPLIEANLNDNKPGDASEIFDAWFNCGGKFTNFAKTIELAKEKGQERLAREWERKLGIRE